MKRKCIGARRVGRQSGFSMIEVLIALLVLAFGLLGLAFMQTLNLRYTKSAEQRTQAVNLAGELLDTMRANRSQLASYAMGQADFTAVADPTTGCPTYAVASAANNILRWQCEVRETLGPGAYAEVDVSGAPVVLVTVHWAEDNLEESPDGVRPVGKIELETTL